MLVAKPLALHRDLVVTQRQKIDAIQANSVGAGLRSPPLCPDRAPSPEPPKSQLLKSQ